MWLPDSLYERLPALYALSGATCLALLGFSGPSVMSAVLLFGASALTTAWRREDRAEARAAAEAAQRRARRARC